MNLLCEIIIDEPAHFCQKLGKMETRSENRIQTGEKRGTLNHLLSAGFLYIISFRAHHKPPDGPWYIHFKCGTTEA